MNVSRGKALRAAVSAWLSIAALLAIGASPAPQAARNAAATSTITAPPGSQFQSDTAHTGVQTASGITPPLGARWRTVIPTHPSYAVVGGGHVFVTYNLDPIHEALLALNEADGSTFFGPVDLGAESSGHYAGLAYDANRVFTNTASCLVDAVDATTGTFVWQNNLNDSDCAGPITASNGIVFVPTLGSVTALSEADGHQLWMNTDNGASPSSPAYTGAGVYVGQAAQFNDASPTTGVTIWHFNGPTTGGGGRTTPVAGGRVYARRSDANTGYVLDAGTGSQLATFTSMNVPAVDSSQAYYETDLTTGVNRVACVNTCRLEAHRISDQALQWSYDGDHQLDTPPLELDGTVYIGSASGTVYGVAAGTGKPVWSGASPDSSVTPGSGGGGGPDIWPYDEQNASAPPSALGAGDGMLFVTFGQTLVAYQHVAAGTVPAFEYHYNGDNASSCDGNGTVIDHGCAWPFQQTAAGEDHAVVDVAGAQPAAVSIVNAAGQTVATSTGSGQTLELWASAVPPGSYTLQVRTTDPTIQMHTLFSPYFEVDTPANPTPSPTPTPSPSPTPTPTPTPSPSPIPTPSPTPTPTPSPTPSPTPTPTPSLTVTAAPASPSASGTQVTLTAAAGGFPNPTYEFWARWDGSSSWQLLRGYSSSPTYVWNSTGALAGTEHFGVWERDAASSAPYDRYTGIPYSVTVPSCPSVTASAAPSSVAHGSGTHVTITGAATGCTNGPRYEFWMRAASQTGWHLVQGWGTSPTYDWNSTGALPGTVYFGVWTRDSSSPAAYDAVMSTTVTVT
jgi:outer membrane protein assembly factor BamB